jgi:hypothetical protein
MIQNKMVKPGSGICQGGGKGWQEIGKEKL